MRDAIVLIDAIELASSFLSRTMEVVLAQMLMVVVLCKIAFRVLALLIVLDNR